MTMWTTSSWFRSVSFAYVAALMLSPFWTGDVAAQELQRCRWIGQVIEIDSRQAGLAVKPEQIVTRAQFVLLLDPKLSDSTAPTEPRALAVVATSSLSDVLGGQRVALGTWLEVRGVIREPGQCHAEMMGSTTVVPGQEGYLRPRDACRDPGAATIAFAVHASQPLGCAVGPQFTSATSIQRFEHGWGLSSLGATYLLPMAASELTSPAKWFGMRDDYLEGEAAVTGLIPPSERLFEPSRGIGKAWREVGGGPGGALGWGVEEQRQEQMTWQQFENGSVVVTANGEAFIILFESRQWEARRP